MEGTDREKDKGEGVPGGAKWRIVDMTCMSETTFLYYSEVPMCHDLKAHAFG